LHGGFHGRCHRIDLLFAHLRIQRDRESLAAGALGFGEVAGLVGFGEVFDLDDGGHKKPLDADLPDERRFLHDEVEIGLLALIDGSDLNPIFLK